MSAPKHSDLPLRDYDHLPVSAVGQRIRSLTADQVGQLLDYERARRPPGGGRDHADPAGGTARRRAAERRHPAGRSRLS